MKDLNKEANMDEAMVQQAKLAMRNRLERNRLAGKAGWWDPLEISASALSSLFFKAVSDRDLVSVLNYAGMLLYRGETVDKSCIREHFTVADLVVVGGIVPSILGSDLIVPLTGGELQSGVDRLRIADSLIRQLPEDHEGRNTWLLNYGNQSQGRNPTGAYIKAQALGRDVLDKLTASGPVYLTDPGTEIKGEIAEATLESFDISTMRDRGMITATYEHCTVSIDFDFVHTDDSQKMIVDAISATADEVAPEQPA